MTMTKSNLVPYKRCGDSHKPLAIPVGKTKAYQIMGGSVYTVNPAKYDVIISFEGSYKGSEMALPWTHGVEFTYRIKDGAAPGNPKNFKKLVEWVADRLYEGDKVFCGCIGGHGRTGTFLAALVAHMSGEKDAIKYVRDNYCKKAVESESQVNFLNKHFGVIPRNPSKTPFKASSPHALSNTHTSDYFVLDEGWKPNKFKQGYESLPPKKVPIRVLDPMPTDLSIHGDNEVI
jgi:hypothetical protein